MFEIVIKISTPEHDWRWTCNDTQCITDKGKRECCCHCPIFINEKKRDKEIENIKSRIENIFYQAKHQSNKDVEKKIIKIFDEKPIEEIK